MNCDYTQKFLKETNQGKILEPLDAFFGSVQWPVINEPEPVLVKTGVFECRLRVHLQKSENWPRDNEYYMECQDLGLSSYTFMLLSLICSVSIPPPLAFVMKVETHTGDTVWLIILASFLCSFQERCQCKWNDSSCCGVLSHERKKTPYSVWSKYGACLKVLLGPDEHHRSPKNKSRSSEMYIRILLDYIRKFQ